MKEMLYIGATCSYNYTSSLNRQVCPDQNHREISYLLEWLSSKDR